MKYGAAFHAQQCVEKAAKAYLVSVNIRPPKIHDLEKIAVLVADTNIELSKLIKKSISLTRYAVVYRYPDAELKPVTFEKIKTEESNELYLAKNAIAIIREHCLKLSILISQIDLKKKDLEIYFFKELNSLLLSFIIGSFISKPTILVAIS